ncbi:MAG TPA: fluoride efflux transporter CrcB [Solirubrobacterales bacterium]|jgi:CrcB protein|nr:fluoride efflux transporter CrcB [Solirubrobacterales bacterium]
MVWVGVAFLGGCGALARFGLTLLVADRLHPHLPVGTLAVNVSGAFLLGVLAGASVEGDARLLFGAGLLGAYTTFSTWMIETQRIGEAGKRRLALANIVLSIALGLAAAALGRWIGLQF